MPSGEFPNGHDARLALQRHYAIEWLDQQEPDLAVMHGPLLLDIIDARIEAVDHDQSIELLKVSWMMRRIYGDTVRPFQEDEYQAKVHAQSVYRGFERCEGPTGDLAFDHLFDLERRFVAGVADPDEYARRVTLLEAADQAAMTIRSRTRPGEALAA